MSDLSPRLGVLACLFAGLAAPAIADERAELVDFFAGQGCAIGPATRDAAIAAGFAPGKIDALQQAEAGRDGAVSGGGWLVMAPESCTIRLPEIGGEVLLSDPEVVAAISAPDAYLDQDSPGCFLRGSVWEGLMGRPGWDADRANAEYMRLLGRALISGEMTFYSPSPLTTPVGFQLTTGVCADAAPMAEIRRDHEFLIRNFDPIMRAFMAENTCDADSMDWISGDINDVPGLTEGAATTNAWTWYGASFIALAAGWREGMTATEKGIARPPMCHYQDIPLPVDARAMKRKTRHD